MKITHLALVAALAAGPALAAPTFISVADDLSNISPTASVTTTSSNFDNLWWERSGFGETEEKILQMWNSESAVITLTLTGLTVGETYDVYVNYIRFGASASLPSGDRGGAIGSLDNTNFILFNDVGGTAGQVGFSELTGHTEGTDRVGLRGYLGTAVANGAGQIVVYVNSGAAVQERVWLDGASYEINIPDETPPVVIEMSPMGAGANPGSDLILIFDENIQAGSGDISIHLASDDNVVASIDVNSGLVSINGTNVVINPPVTLDFGTTYYVNLPGGAFTDLSGNPSDAINDTTTWQFTTAVFDPNVLFADNFNRPDNTDLNASVNGKSGSLGNLDWIEVKSGGEPTVTADTLRLGDSLISGGWSIAYLDHNFIDPSITAGGEFTVSVDLGATTSSGGTRFTGFAIGHSLAEVSGWSTNLPPEFTSDFFIGYDPTGTTEVKIFRAGQQTFQQTVNLSGGATLSVRFSGISNFNSGSTVQYEAFIDGGLVATGSFFWSGTDENYIALYSNYSNMQGILDNFEVRTSTGTPPADLFSTWAATGTLPGTVTFEGDLNGDGVRDGIAFLLGVANPDDDATGALPTVSENGSGGLVLTFDCLAVDDRGSAQLRVAHSNTLAGWTATTDVVPDAAGTDAGGVVSYMVDTVSVDPLHRVTATIDPSVASEGRLFGCIEGAE